MRRIITLTSAIMFCLCSALPAAGQAFVQFKSSGESMALLEGGTVTPIWVDGADHTGVIRAAKDLQADFERVGDVSPSLAQGDSAPAKEAIIIGSLDSSPLIKRLADAGKIDGSSLEGRWEAYLLQVVESPLPGVDRALVIAGSDKRGTIYGIYTLSQEIGVSPWYWWADVPPLKHDSIFVSGRIYDDGPTVKYRGIFLNDEAPALSGWAQEKFGGLNSEFYGHVFELVLRLKGNYLWPAMWGNAFNEDDPENPRLANEYGVVMGTSHHEPMIRAQQEWWRHGEGPWNYETNGETLREFWAKGIRRNKDFESIVTMGMRGDGDEAMSEDTNVALLERIVADQREILEREMGEPAEDIPQLWALYKEVQDYYEHGMRVPDDVTLLWCDDNWGNIRRLPLESERERSGGAGIYYHFDYVGGPRSYKWLNTTNITKTWEQMHLAWKYDATRIWIVNVGDLKPMEVPISFFLDYAWDPQALPYEKLPAWSENWAAQQFGEEHAPEVAALIDGYTKLNSLRKPEQLEPGTWSVTDCAEATRILSRWQDLTKRAEALASKLSGDQQDAFFELVLYPVKACTVVNELYVTAARNNVYALQGRASTNTTADHAKALFEEDAELARTYNEDIAGGKWQHMMDQNNIGWTYWQQPPLDTMPAVHYVQTAPVAALGVALEGSKSAWPANDIFQGKAVLPTLDPYSKKVTWIELFRRGEKDFSWEAEASEPWVKLSQTSGKLGEDQRVWVSIDWHAVPEGATDASIHIRSEGGRGSVSVNLPVHIVTGIPEDFAGAVLINGQQSILAKDFQAAIDGEGLEWTTLPNFGRSGSGVTAYPVPHDRIAPSAGSPHLEYDFYVGQAGKLDFELQVAPTLNFLSGDGIKVAVSVDDAEPQQFVVGTKVNSPEWNRAVTEGVRRLVGAHKLSKPGKHTLKVWYVDPGVVIERILLRNDGKPLQHCVSEAVAPLPEGVVQ